MNTPANLKSAANCLIAVGFFYLLITSLVVFFSDHTPDTFGKVFVASISALGLLLWFAAILLYRCNKVGKWIWWACCPIVLIQVPIGTALGFFVFVYLNKPDSIAALSGRTPFVPPPLPRQ
jgi:peptidoglycan biosynthesis protein MviN/MurJ (putative lipid II flippase)